MSLDELARAAASELHRGSGAGADTDALLGDLSRTRTRRARARTVAAGLAVVVLGVSGWLVLAPRAPTTPPASPSPSPSAVTDAEPAANGVIAVADGSYVHAFDPVTGARVPTVQMPGYAQLRGIAWSPDGKTLYFTTDRSLRAVDTSTGVKTTLMPCRSCEVSASPDGRTLVVAEDHALRLVDLATGSTSVLMTDDAGRLLHPQWSRDGSRIAYVVTVIPPGTLEPSETVLETVRADGTGRVRLTDSTAAGSWTLIGPSWSRDDVTLAFMGVPDGKAERPIKVFTIPSTGGAPHQVMTAGSCYCAGFWPGLTWSPDGAQLAVVGADGLVFVDARTEKPVRTLKIGAMGAPAWQPVPIGP